MNFKSETRTYEIETLTPLHIGDGNILKANWDFISTKNKVSIYDIDSIINAVKDNPKALKDFGTEDSNLNRFISNYGIEIKAEKNLKAITLPPERNLSAPGKSYNQSNITELKTTIKNGFGKPYIPGSSIKGALRTALWVSLDRNTLPPINDKAFEREVKKIAGVSAHDDFLKPLTVSDSDEVQAETLIVQEVKVMSLKFNGQSNWKPLKIFVESIPQNTKVNIKLGLKEFNPEEKIKLGITACKSLSKWSEMIMQINAHSKNMAEQELTFFERYKLNDIAEFYKGLINTFDSLTDGSFIMRLSWGSGWTGMTGNWIHDTDDLMAVRKKNKLGKFYYQCPDCMDKTARYDKQKKRYKCSNPKCGHEHNYIESKAFEIFPKSRRLAYENQKGTFSLPMGWIIATPSSKDTFIRKTILEQNLPDNIKIETKDDKALIEDEISSFRLKVNAIKNLSGEIQPYLKKIDDIKFMEQKKEMILILLDKALADKKGFKRAVKDAKAWAVELDKLCKENGIDYGVND